MSRSHMEVGSSFSMLNVSKKCVELKIYIQHIRKKYESSKLQIYN